MFRWPSITVALDGVRDVKQAVSSVPIWRFHNVVCSRARRGRLRLWHKISSILENSSTPPLGAKLKFWCNLSNVIKSSEKIAPDIHKFARCCQFHNLSDTTNVV